MIYRILIVFLIFVTGCNNTIEQKKSNNPKAMDHAISSVLIAKANTLSENIIIPNTPKVGDKCPQCNDPPGQCGVGKVGDGVICDKCLMCNGDGRIDQEDLSKEFIHGYIINMKSRDSCRWCIKWNKEVRPEIEKMGFVINTINSNGSVPQFEIMKNDKKYKHVGFMSLDKFMEIQNKLK